jgi:hypothetical protein
VMHRESMTNGFLPSGFFHRLLGVATAYMQETLSSAGRFWTPDLAKHCGHLYVVSSALIFQTQQLRTGRACLVLLYPQVNSL